MKKIGVGLLLISLSQFLFAQEDIAHYIRLDVRYYTEDGERYLGVSPDLQATGDGPLSRGMVQYPRRFRYLLLNKTRFQNTYEKYYPDTLKINRLYTDSLSMDPDFMRWYRQLSSPFTGKAGAPVHFSRKELMRVAARFFYCQSVRPDSSISSTICIGLNGLNELTRTRDLTLLEAFCFEAIFERYYSRPGVKSRFINNFLSYISEAVRVNKPGMKSQDQYLLEIRAYCFRQMETDKDLEAALMDYYKAHAGTFPFTIE